MVTASETVDLHVLDQGGIQRQATYLTGDKVAVVQRWYAARLKISPASEQYTTASDGSAWLTHTDQALHILHTVSVLLYPAPAGTKVVVNESLALEH